MSLPFDSVLGNDSRFDGIAGKDINNPKIPIKFVRAVGKLVYETTRTVTEVAEDTDEARRELKMP